MKKILYLITFFLIYSLNLYSSELDFEKHLLEEKLFIDSINHYNFKISNEHEKNKNYFIDNIVKFSYGSISGKTFLQRENILLNKTINEKLLFHANIYNETGFHLNKEIKKKNLGLQRLIYKNIYLTNTWDFSGKKDEIDVKLGVNYKFKNNDYINLNFSWYDFLYNSKNKLEGEVTQNPLGIEWKLFKTINKKYSINSNGEIINTFKRKYEKLELSSNLNQHSSYNNYFETILNYNINKTHKLFIKQKFLFFLDEKEFLLNEDTYKFKDNIEIYTLNYNINLDKLKPSLNITYINKNTKKYNEYNFKRKELMPSIFLDYKLKNIDLKSGYILSNYYYKYNIDDNNYNHKFVDKFIFGLKYNINKKTFIEFTASHIRNKIEFGGANIKFYTKF